MKEKISKIMLKRTNQIIALIVLIITAIGAIAVSRNRIKNITNLDSETARAMTYGEVQAGDEKTTTPYVEFNSYFLRDLNNDGIAEKIKGTCKEISQTDTLYMDINVLTNGYLENGKIEIQGENFALQTAIVKDAVVAKNSISENTKTIELNKINNGTQKLLMGKVKANIGKNINNYSSNNNKIILTGTHVTEDGTRTEIRKEIVLSTDWYGKVENTMLVTTSNTVYNIDKALDEKNRKINLEFVVETYETLNELLLKTSTIEGTIPELNGYKPTEVKITGGNIEYTYDETTGKFTATNKSTLNTNIGAVTKEAYNETYYTASKTYRENKYNLKVVYPYEAYETLGRDTISLNIPISSVYEGYNNQNTEFENPVKSNIAQYSYTFIWKKVESVYRVDIGTYRPIDYSYVISKKEPLKIYNGELNGETSEETIDKYETRWYLNTTEGQENNKAKLQLKEPTTNYGDKFLTTESKYIDMTPYTKNIGIYFDGATNLVKEDGYINLYNDETNELIHTFTKEELAKYTSSNPYMYEHPVKHIRLETTEVKANSTSVYNIKQIDDEALTTAYTKTEFDKLQYIYTYLQVNTMQTNGTWSQSGSDTDRAIYEEPISRTQLELSRTQFSTQEREKNVDIKIATVANYFNIDKWKNGAFLVKLPSEILDVEINKVKVSNSNIRILGYEVLEKDGSKFIKILTQNETPTSYTLTVNVDITADPRILTTSKTVELYAYNQETNNYAEKTADKYDVNDNGNVSENVNYVTKSLDLISPSSLLTNEKISNYNSKGDFVVSPQIAEIDIDETKNATVEVSITNNYSGAISDIVVVGKIPFKGNKYQLQDTTDLGSTITTNLTGPITLPTELQGIAKVYYSENETITKDVTDSSNNFKTETQVTDWSKIKTYVIDLGYHKLEVDKEYKFTYKIELPTVLKYNEVTYSTHAVYFALNTENGKLYLQTEAGKVGIRVARKYDINITKTKLGKDIAVQGTTFSLVEEGQEEGKVVVTNYEGKATIQNVYAERTYILKEAMQSIGYSASNTEIKFRTYVENNELKYEIISGQAKTNSVTQATEDTKAHIDFSFENVPKYTIMINKKDTEGNNLRSVKYRITGNNIDKNVYTNKDGIAKIQDLEAGEEYTLTEERATGYYILQEPIKFKLNNNNGTLSFTIISGSFNSNAQITESTEVSGKQAEDKVEVSLVNEKIPTYDLQITKYAKDQETTLSGAQFKIEGEGIKEGGEYITTDENGVLKIEGLYQYVEGKYITGEYTITEITPPEGYKLIEEPIKVRYNNGTLEILRGTIKGEATVEDGIAKIGVENEPLFVLTKINEVTKAPIQGVKFAIYEIDENRNVVDYAKDTKGNYVGTEETINGTKYRILTTNEKGIITAGLKEGLYKAVEVQAPKSFEFNENEENRTSYFGIGKSTPAVKETKAVWENTEKEYIEYRGVIAVTNGVIAVGAEGKVVKYDLEGNVVWKNTEKSYSYQGVDTVEDGVIAVGGGGKVVKYDLRGNIVWENTEKSYHYRGVATVEDGVIAVGLYGQVVKYDLEGNVVWENTEKSYMYRGVTTVEDGVIAVVDYGKVVKYDLEGNIIWENTEKSYRYYGVTTVEDGIIAVGDSGKVVKFDLEGNVVWENTEKSYGYEGVTTVADGVIAVGYSGPVVKYDLEGNVVWENVEKAYEYNGVTTVEDELIAVGSYGQVVKYDLEGNVVWENTEKSYSYFGVITVEGGVIAVSYNGQVVKYDLEGNILWENSEKTYRYRGVTTVADGVIAVSYTGQVVKYDLEGNIEWENTEKSYRYTGVTTVEDGVIAVAFDGQVVKYDLEGNVVWENTEKTLPYYHYEGVTTVEDGVIAVEWYGQVVKYDLKGNVVWENTEKSYMYYGVTTVEDGVITVGDYGIVKKYDLEGNVEWENTEKSYTYLEVTTIEDGVIAVGNGGKVVKYDLEGNVVWENTEKSHRYIDVTKVADGVIVVGHYGQVVKYSEVETSPEIASSQEITVQNKIKELKIKTEVEQYEKDGIIITGGTITGQEEEYVEQVEYEKDSTKKIKAVPDTGYRVEKITVNGEQIEFTPNEDGSVTLSKFIQVTEDKEIVVKFSNSIGQVKVNHYIKGTTTVVPDEEIDTSSKTITGEIGTRYTTEPLVGLKEYELVKDSNGEYEVPENAVGTYTEGVQEVNYYYELKDVKLTVHHYLENSETKLAEDEEKVGKIHTNYTTEKSNTIDYTKYELVEEPGNKEGTLEQDTEVTYYYKLKEGKVIVHHYIQGTTTQVPSKDGSTVADETIIGKVDETYTTKVSENIATNYEYVSKTTNSTGIITADTIEVTYYYKMKAGTVEENNITKEGTGIIYTPEQEVEYSINYTTKITNYKGRVQVIITDKLPQAIDETKSDIADGEYDSTNKTITWKQYLPEVDTTNGEAEEITVTKQIKLVYKSLQEGTTITNKVEGSIKLLDTNQEETKETGKETKINEYVNATVEKVWSDNNNANGKRPESIKLQVKNGDTVVKEQVVTETENWKYTFTDLPMYDGQGNTISYTVDEQEVNTDDLKFYTKTISGTTITNTFTVPEDKTEVTVEKVWADNENANGKRPESIKLQVKNGNTVVRIQEVTEAENWKYTFTNLPKYNAQGNEIAYTVDEQEVNANDLKFYTKAITGTTITNTFTVPEDKTEVTVNKVWNDNGNANSKRPESIKLLVKNGDITVAEQVVTEAENWKYTFADLPKYNEQGNVINYTADEQEVNANDLKFYTKTIDGMTITNTFNVPDEKVSVTVNKVWQDNENANSKCPESIKLLVKNGDITIAEQVVTQNDGWKYVASNLPKYDTQGNEIEYTVDEQEVNTDDLKFYTKVISGTTITNTFTVPEDKTEVTVSKVWNDNNDINSKRPESIKLQVKNGNTVVRTQKVTEAENWEYTFTDLPKYNSQGNEIVYTVDEQEVNANDLKFYTKAIEGTTVINTFTVPEDKTEVTVAKVWDDNNNANSKRPESIKLQVKNGTQVVAEQVVTEAENWKYTFTNLAKYNEQGNVINYTADEQEVNVNDLMFYTKEVKGTTITNTFSVPDNKISITVNKMWNDGNNMYGKRPGSIKLQIKEGNRVVQEATVTENDGWRYTFTDLAKYDGQGNEINYIVDEQEVNANDLKFYTKEVNGTMITNTFTVPDEKVNVTIEKVWKDNNNENNKRPEAIMLQVKNGQMIVEEQEVTAKENWRYTFTDLAKYDMQGNEITYTADEKEINVDDLKFYTKTIDGMTITNTFTVPEDKTEITVSKVWNDNNNVNSKRPESIKLLVKNGVQVVAEQVVTEAENWQYTFTDLPKYNAQGDENVYTVDEQEVNTDDLKFYTKTIDGMTITNTFTVPDEKINVTVSKVWNDNNNESGKRPESIKLLVKNGDTVVKEQVVTETDNWKYTFTDLPKYNAQGDENVYTVDEAEVNENDLKFYTKTIEGMTITNTFTVPEDKTEITVSKVWNDNENASGKRPESIKLQVKSGDTVVKEQVVTETENWKYTFIDLPKYNAQGDENVYTVDEAEVNENDLKFYTKTIEGTTITNTFTVPNDKITLKVSKVWDDSNNAKGYRPESIKLLVKNGNILVVEQVITKEENWENTFTDLAKYDEQGNEIIYTVEEAEVNSNELERYKGELSKVVGNEAKEVIIVNTYNYGNIVIKYVDKETGEELGRDEIEGKIGDGYATNAREIKGYKNTSKTENSKGKISEGTTVVIYYYEKIKEETKPVTPILPTTGDTFITEMIILVASATAYLAVLALKHKRCK